MTQDHTKGTDDMMGECEYCKASWDDDTETCDATTHDSLGTVLGCCREEGHEGQHVACTGESHEIETWEDGAEK